MLIYNIKHILSRLFFLILSAYFSSIVPIFLRLLQLNISLHVFQRHKNFIFFYYFCKVDEHHYLHFINKEIKEENQ